MTQACGAVGDPNRSFELLAEIKAAGITPTAGTYNALIKAPLGTANGGDGYPASAAAFGN